MLSLLLALALPMLSEDPKPAPPEAKKEAKAPEAAKGVKRRTVAVPEEKPAAEPTHEKAAAARPRVPRAPARPREVAHPAPYLRVAEAEARAARLSVENARLQQELAKREQAGASEVRSPDEALAELKAGNQRFVDGRRVRTLLSLQDPDLRRTLARGQAPFAAVITCSDSRLVDTLIFDQELGRLFTIREAGNSPDLQGIASAEYAAEHLGSRLVLVLGHTACGAIKAVKEAHGHPLPGNLWSLQAAMAGLLEAVHEDPNATPSESMRRLAEVNAQRQARALLDRSEILRHLVAAGKLKVVPALYDLESGRVAWLELPAVSAARH